MICEQFSPFFLLLCNADSLLCRAYLMQSYITQLGNFWARQRRSLVGGGGRQQVSHRWALHLLCIPSPRTVCLSVSSPQTQGNLRISSFFQLFPSFPVQVSRWGFFLAFFSSSTDAAFLSAHLPHMSVLCGSRYSGRQRGGPSVLTFHSLVTRCDSGGC